MILSRPDASTRRVVSKPRSFLELWAALIGAAFRVLYCAVGFMCARSKVAVLALGMLIGGSLALPLPQRVSTLSADHPAIEYSTRPTNDPVAKLNQRIEANEARLSFDGPSGYLRAVLEALDIPVESQTLVFSETSLQREHITKTHPRALYFNDSVAVGWVPGAETIELAAQDPQQGVVFYQLAQDPQAKPRFERGTECMQCHNTAFTGGVPGMFVMSMLPLSDDPNEYAQGWGVDHRTPVEDRWGGWYVTARHAPERHLGNVPVHHVERSYVRAATAPKLASVAGEFDASVYPSSHSDVAALLVLNHQVAATNLITRLGWEARVAAHEARAAQSGLPENVRETVNELVDYLLFVDEAPLPSRVEGSSDFARVFAARGPRDRQGRSLRDLDLEQRLPRYPCSYMIYTDAFDALPGAAKAAVYERIWEVLSGAETRQAYAGLTLADRRAVVEILRETKPGLPQYFDPGRAR